jgi:alpha-beta hydrolase superfamily lysophospholipase
MSMEDANGARNPKVNDLFTRAWRARGETTGSVLIAHGLGEHSGRYAHVAAFLNNAGWDVFALDHFGHGQSPGARGAMLSESHYLDNLGLAVDWARTHSRAGPFVLLGHSMGGGLSASFVRRNVRPLDGLILSSPALDPGLGGAQRALLGLLAPVAPNLRIPNGLNAQRLCRDPQVVKAYLADRPNHNRIAVRLVKFLADEGPRSLAAASSWPIPTLLVYAGADQLVNPQGCARFAASGSATIESQVYPAMDHEILNDPDKALVLARIAEWLKRFATSAPKANHQSASH